MLERTFGCARFIYNWALALRRDAYAERGQMLSYGDLSAALTALKQDPAYVWLNEVSSVPVQQAVRHLDRAYRNFFEGRASYPKFKRKHGPQAATYMPVAFQWDGKAMTLAKMREPLDIRWSRPFAGEPSSVSITRDRAGRYFMSFVVEEEIAPKPPSPRAVGIDLGLHALVATSDGTRIPAPRFFRRAEKRVARAHRAHSRKKLGSHNREKARRKVARAHARVTDCRNDFLHKLTTTLINENQVICVEDLAVQNLVRNHSRSKSISDASWGELVRQLKYKAAWYGRTVQQVDRFFPSTKRCSVCGNTLAELDLSVRQWTCPVCGTTHDRDVNAAKNVLAAGLAASACGGPVRPEAGQPVAARLVEAGRVGE